jgi:hypothetical protein
MKNNIQVSDLRITSMMIYHFVKETMHGEKGERVR